MWKNWGRFRGPLTMAVTALLLIAAGGCGEDQETAKAKPKLLPGQISLDETVYECLAEVGVQFAVARRDLAFFRDARAADDVTQIGEEEDEEDGVVVRLLASKREGPAKWMLWYSQPPAASGTPEEIVEYPITPAAVNFSPRDPYVAFKVGPKKSFRDEIHRCVEFPLTAG
jgi:hypothetical protein